MAPSDGSTAVTPMQEGFTFGPLPWGGAAEDAPLSAFASPQQSRRRDASASPQRSAGLGSRDSGGNGSSRSASSSGGARPMALPPLPAASSPARRPTSGQTPPPQQVASRRYTGDSASSVRPAGRQGADDPPAEGPPSPGDDVPMPPAGSWGAAATPTQDVPSGMDAASFAAGECAALLRVFREALPGQAAVGELRAAMQALQGRQEADAARVEEVKSDAASLRAAVQGVVERVAALEHVRLPALDARVDSIAAAGPSQEFRQTLGALQEVLAELASRPAAAAGSPFGPPAASTVSATARGWAVAVCRGLWGAAWSAVSQTDVAAMALARRVLLPMQNAQGGAGTVGAAAAADPARAVLGAALLVAAAEAAAAAQRRAAALAPRSLNQARNEWWFQHPPRLGSDLLKQMWAPELRTIDTAAAPLRAGISAARIVVWAAALALSAARVRAACFLVADVAAAAAQRAAHSRAARRAAALLRQERVPPAVATPAPATPQTPAQRERHAAKALADEAAARAGARAARAATPQQRQQQQPAAAAGASADGSSRRHAGEQVSAAAAAEAAQAAAFDAEPGDVVYEMGDFPGA